MLQCFKFAGDTPYSVSEHTLHYCYGYNTQRHNSSAYSICIPSPCAEDNLTVSWYYSVEFSFFNSITDNFLYFSKNFLELVVNAF